MQDQIMPESKWVFDEDVTNVFDEMLARSIPQYDVMRELVYKLGAEIIDNCNSNRMLDIGCSNGINFKQFIYNYGARLNYTGIDVSEPMLNKAREVYKGYIDSNLMRIKYMDLRYEFPADIYALITSILTIQFTPIEYRQSIIQNCYDNLTNNGALILVEKVIGNNASIDKIMVNQYLDMKHSNGYSKEQIDRKKESLEGVLVPVTAKWNEELLKQAGFRKIDCFWRWLNFAGWIAIK